jgi:hypothetical protein
VHFIYLNKEYGPWCRSRALRKSLWQSQCLEASPLCISLSQEGFFGDVRVRGIRKGAVQSFVFFPQNLRERKRSCNVGGIEQGHLPFLVPRGRLPHLHRLHEIRATVSYIVDPRFCLTGTLE